MQTGELRIDCCLHVATFHATDKAIILARIGLVHLIFVGELWLSTTS